MVMELERMHPGRRFLLDGHLVGSIGEAAAEAMFALSLQPASTNGHDAICVTDPTRVSQPSSGSSESSRRTLSTRHCSTARSSLCLVRDRLERGIDVADIGCGSGYALNVLARAFPNSRFTGFDFSEEAIGVARTEAADWRLSNVTFEVRDVSDLGRTAAFDFITTFDAVHDQADPARVLRGIGDALRSDGVYLCVDIAASSHLEENLEHPLGPAIYTISTMHCMTVSLALGGAGLGAVWGEQTARQILSDAGFTNVATERIEGDVFNVYCVARKT